MKVAKYLLIGALYLLPLQSHAWNEIGHQVIVQIAYDNLSPKARFLCNKYNNSLNKVFKRQSLVRAGAWMDTLRYGRQVWLKHFHYIDTPYSEDNTPLGSPYAVNAISAIEEAKIVLAQKKGSNYNKGFSLRVLLHVIGDLHQPLHAINRFSQAHPQGDKGGNLFVLAKNPVAKNLHAYWDQGGGVLTPHKNIKDQVQKIAKNIEARWACHPEALSLAPTVWQEESFQLSVNKAYQLTEASKPSLDYQTMVQNESMQRMALAGCRLAGVLNKLLA